MENPNDSNAVLRYRPATIFRGGDDQDVKTLPQENYIAVDALYHYFVTEDVPAGDPDPDVSPSMSQGTVIAKLLAGSFAAIDCGLNECKLFTEVVPNRFRHSTSFIGGELTSHEFTDIKRQIMDKFGDNTVYLDASGYTDEKEVGSTYTPFERLMNLANNTKTVIDDGICERWATDTRTALNFINAAPTDLTPQETTDEFSQRKETKWITEGRFLANELIEIPSFKRNFNKLVIYGAMRYIVSGDLNINKLYRLLAKLGRVNTSIYFVG